MCHVSKSQEFDFAGGRKLRWLIVLDYNLHVEVVRGMIKIRAIRLHKRSLTYASFTLSLQNSGSGRK